MTPQQKVVQGLTLAKVHQWVTLTIIPGMLSIILWFVLLMYKDWEKWRDETEGFKKGQVKRDYEQDIKIDKLEYRVEAVNNKFK
jgi:hypothetical protein